MALSSATQVISRGDFREAGISEAVFLAKKALACM
jgi:hypothetical protein